MPELPLVEELVPAPDPTLTTERFLGQPHLLFLDSAADPERLGRYSFLSAAPSGIVQSKGPGGTPALDQARALLTPHTAAPIEGLPPDLVDTPPGCPFVPRCPFAIDKCRDVNPDLLPVARSHNIACWVDVTGGKGDGK